MLWAALLQRRQLIVRVLLTDADARGREEVGLSDLSPIWSLLCECVVQRGVVGV